MTYKATILFGEQTASEYKKTGKIPENFDDGSVHKVEFITNAEYDAYCQGLYDNTDWLCSEVIPEKEYNPQIICTRCGGTDVACIGAINPNSGQALAIIDEAFYDGHCEQCGSTILSNMEDALKSINEKYAEFKNKNVGEPLFAKCEIAYTEKGPEGINEFETVTIKLSPNVIDSEDDQIFFNCQDLEELKSFVHPDKNTDFVVIDCLSMW